MKKAKITLIIGIIIVIAIVVLMFVLFFKKSQVETPIIADEVYGFSGQITEIQDNAFLINARILLTDSEKEPMKQALRILIKNETQILRLDFPKDIPADNTKPIFPEETKIDFKDLKTGDRVNIETIDNAYENIINKSDIVASIINIIE
jgi:hypothetical protein